MLSRVADSIYWMSRSVERAENLARFIDVTLNLMLDLPQHGQDQWQPLVDTTGDHERFTRKYGAATQENVIKFLTFDREYSNSILSCLASARENARAVRETIASEMWEHLNQFYHTVKDAARSDVAQENPYDFFHEVKMSSHLFKGITDGTMSHNEGWHFAKLGRVLERADKTSRILDVKYFMLNPSVTEIGTSFEDLQWSSVLRSVSGFEMYRKKHHGITPSRVIDFLLLDRFFPRAIHYCVASADESLHAISGTPLGTFCNVAEQRVGQLRAELAYGKIDDIFSRGVHEFIDSLQDKLNFIGDGIYETFTTLRPEVSTSPAR